MSEVVGYRRWMVGADQHTHMRRAAMFWIAQLRWGAGDVSLSPTAGLPEGAKQGAKQGVWLVRSAANPDWHGIESDVPSGEAPMHRLQRNAECIIGAPPKYMDQVAILQPHDKPGITRTTYIYNAMGDVLPRPQLPGIELGLFPIDELPEQELEPRYQNWLAPMLKLAIEEGMTNPMEYIGPPYENGPRETIIFDSAGIRR